MNRHAPCGCEYEVQAGVVLAWRDCRRHGNNVGTRATAPQGLGAIFG